MVSKAKQSLVVAILIQFLTCQVLRLAFEQHKFFGAQDFVTSVVFMAFGRYIMAFGRYTVQFVILFVKVPVLLQQLLHTILQHAELLCNR
jgi:hypothetical protein